MNWRLISKIFSQSALGFVFGKQRVWQTLGLVVSLLLDLTQET